MATAKTPQEQTILQRQIDATDRQIDQLVYDLYGLTDAEIKIVEAANSRSHAVAYCSRQSDTKASSRSNQVTRMGFLALRLL